MKVNLSGDASTGVRVFRPNSGPSTTSRRIRKMPHQANPYMKRKRYGAGCNITINCGPGARPFRPRRPILAPKNQQQFDKLSEDELIYLMENAPNPELMGSRLKKFFQRAKKKAKGVLKKVKAKWKKLPKWARIATGALALPFAPATATAALTAAPIAATAAVAKKAHAKIKKMTPAQRRRLAMGVGAVLLPGSATAAATTYGAYKAAKATGSLAKKGVAAIQQRRAAQLAAQRQAQQQESAQSVVVPAAVKQQIENGEGAQVATTTEAAEPAKKSGLSSILPFAALAALPFFLGSSA